MTWISTITSPERYIRINITRNTKGYQAETTVSLRWTGEDDGSADEVGAELEKLNRRADDEARVEIARREELDAGVERAEASP